MAYNLDPQTGANVSDRRRKDVDGAIDHDFDREPGDDTPWVEVWGNRRNYNIDPILHQNILMSDYFKYVNREVHSYQALATETIKECQHIEPYSGYGHRKLPSDAFCFMMKMCMMRVTEMQLKELIDPRSNVYVRAVAFLYLRYTCVPKELWEWYQPFLEEETPIKVSKTPSDEPLSMGKLLLNLLLDQRYFDTMLPRIPVPVFRDIQAKVIALKTGKAQQTKSSTSDLQVGDKVSAQWVEDEVWYDNAVIDEVMPDGKYLVTFTDFGNQDVCTSEMVKPKKTYGKKRPAAAKTDDEEELARLLNKEKDKATALYDGKYFRRPKEHHDFGESQGRNKKQNSLDVGL